MQILNCRASQICIRKVFLIITIIVGICMLNSCVNSIVDEPTIQKSRVSVDINTFSIELEELNTNTRVTSDAATRLSFAVFDSNDALVESVICQNSSEDDFGTVELELFPGDYKLVAVAHNGTADAEIKSDILATLPGLTFTDTFAKVQSLTVKSGEDSNLSMELSRLTSAFILRLTDTPPANAKEIQVVVNNTGTDPTSLNFNPSTGLASGHWKQVRIIPVADLYKDNPIYFIKMHESTVVNIKATAYATDGTEIISHTINNVPLVANQKTIATGNFFKSQSSGTFTLDTEWDADKEIQY